MQRVGEIFNNAHDVNGVKVICARMDGSAPDELRKLGDSVKDKQEDIIALFAGANGEKGTFYCVCTKGAVAKGANAGKLVRETAAITGGKAAESPTELWQAQAILQKLTRHFAQFESIVASMVK